MEPAYVFCTVNYYAHALVAIGKGCVGTVDILCLIMISFFLFFFLKDVCIFPKKNKKKIVSDTCFMYIIFYLTPIFGPQICSPI